MSEMPPPWDPFGDQPEPASYPPPESYPAPASHPAPVATASSTGHRGVRKLPVIPLAFTGGGLVLGVIATVLISNLGGSSKPAPVAAPLATSVTSSAASAPTSRAVSAKPSPKKTASAAPVVLPPAAESGLAHAAPTSVQIPKIGVSSTLVSLGLQSDGTLQVPDDYAKAGWYANGAYPGDANEPPALIVGHVDDYRGPAVFFRLKELSVGDRVLVPRTDGSTATFVVYQTANYLKTGFPSATVYAPTKRPELRLITCTGQFDSGARSYLSNFVAYAYLESGSG